MTTTIYVLEEDVLSKSKLRGTDKCRQCGIELYKLLGKKIISKGHKNVYYHYCYKCAELLKII